MATKNSSKHVSEATQLMRCFLKKIVNNDKRAKQLFKLYFDRNEISEEQFYEAISDK